MLVLGPSLGTSVAVLWQGALAHLQESFTLIGWDLPGHGDAEPFTESFEISDLADALEELVAELADNHGLPADLPVYAAGVSIAGTVSLTLALRGNTRFTRLAALCTAAKIGDPQMWSERAELVAQAGTPTMVEGSAQRWFAPGFMAREPEVVTGLLHCLQHTDRHSYAAACRALGRYDLTAELAGVARPLLVISGVEDPVCPPSAVQDLAAAPHTQTAVLDGVAHQPRPKPRRPPPDCSRSSSMTDPHYQDGMKVRREVLSDAHVDRAEAKKDDFTEDFQELITNYAWGSIWTRPGLDRSTRSVITLTALIAGGYWEELEMHIRAALRNGLTEDQIKEVFLQCAIYCSVPAANTAFSIGRRVLQEERTGQG